ncbi:hypothetical protein TL5118_02494 [Thalassovita autumnalis]|uniref:T6SS Phospholipase effector Tle1-like catalytic domain-containing protein n=1 Tax=Thalassovita autumnalis TaxID=2072972 RepID=A0A0N7LY04_9RHOB|nr:DUF2235 domain-containing protein [Thalassovita autumnalis]CUH68147.1 hypothetical protein TL5118_02494 [Thalassovita autumnalis]CUH73364.1 hypothetical protein TL5120_03172 [Thalassovita autumnalis]
MQLNKLAKRFIEWIKPGRWSGRSPVVATRGNLVHVIILDGTMSSLDPGCETNAGLAYRLVSQMGAPVSVYYEAGVQWSEWRQAPDVLMGRGINRQIRRAYGYLCSRYRPGDKIFLLGYSRGAYAVRSLGGVIDQVGLLKPEHATERNIQTAYRHYQCTPGSEASAAFTSAYCHDAVEIEMIGVWDTVKALGVRLPFFWKWAEVKHGFHSHQLGEAVKHGFHALALDETREVFEPVLWSCDHPTTCRVEQVWFRGSHGDVGGQLSGREASRPLSNIPLVWMLENAEDCGLPLPEGWRATFPQDAAAPSVGTWSGWGKMFLLRKKRNVGQDLSEQVHDSAAAGDGAGETVAPGQQATG